MAALAAMGAGQGARGTPADTARYRELALGWLEADLEALRHEATDPQAQDHRLALRTLRRWRADPDLESVRAEEALAQLPESEGRRCRALWESVGELLRREEPHNDDPYLDNPSFEAQPLGEGQWIDGMVVGWTVNGHFAGVQNMHDRDYNDPIPDGLNVAFSRGPTISQELAEPLRAHKRYSLSVEVGNGNISIFPNYRVQLWAGGELIAEDNSTLHPPNGEFATSSVTFVTGAYHPAFGHPLEVRLLAPEIVDRWGRTQVHFDDVRLEVSRADGGPASIR